LNHRFWLRLLVVISCSWMLWVWGCQPPSHDTQVPIGQQTQSIIGGTPDLRHPEVGALAHNQRTFCTGTLIASRVVLTAAHCVDAALRYVKAGQRLQFRIDTPNTKVASGFDIHYFDFDPSLFKNHPKWTTDVSDGGDIGFGILKTKVKIATPMPVNLTSLSSQLQGKNMLFLGYGLIQSTPTSISPNKKYGAEIPMKQLLADRFVHEAPNKSVCHGDSGGPALVLVLGKLRVIGVNSYVNAPQVPGSNPPRSSCTGTGTSMRTDTYTSFIQSILKTYGDGDASCTSTAECGLCARCSGNKKCEPVPFSSQPQVCKPCQKDEDCGSDSVCYRFDTGYRCLRKCNTNGCCPSGTYCNTKQTTSGVQTLCLPFEQVCPAISCTTNKDCGPGEVCDNSQCRPAIVAANAQLCQPCKKDEDCGPKGRCFGLEGSKRCTQACGAGDFCPAGYTCKELYPGVPSQCTPEEGGCQTPCTLSAHCPDGEICIAGACSPPQGGEYGDACHPAPCKDPLTCADTISGKRCIHTCGIPEGNAGSACTSNNTCVRPMNCYSLGSTRLCLHPCNTTQDCAAIGGGSCQSGVCQCRNNNECGADYICNNISNQIGACAPKAQNKTCESGFSCRSFQAAGRCVKEAPGNRSLGQECDAFNTCQEGLRCVSTGSVSRCFEDCSKTQTCQSGGVCNRFSNIEICVCYGNDACPKGRTCQLLFGPNGMCLPPGTKNDCASDQECPTQTKCVAGKCLYPNEIEEPAPEPKAEPTTEPVTEPEVEPSAPDEPAPVADASAEKDPTPEPKKEALQASGGCNCTTHSSPPWDPLLFVCLLLPLFLRRRQEARS